MSQIRYALAAAAVAILAVGGCSSPKSPAHPAATGHAVAAPSTKAPASPTTSATSPAGLTGKWSGQYSGSYNGTFVLHWRQNGSKLKGTINLSAPADTLPINGSVQGESIRFGTVGSTAITYSGTVSGSSMSGHWEFHDGSGAGGPWSASKAS